MSRGRVSNPRAPGTADLLGHAALIDDGLVLCKDGSLLAGFFFRGPDQESATPEERNYLTARVNAALSRLGSGFALWIDAVRLPSAAYPEPPASHFPETLSRAIDEERRRHFLSEGAHFESEHALLIQYTPPVRRESRIARRCSHPKLCPCPPRSRRWPSRLPEAQAHGRLSREGRWRERPPL